MTDELRAPGAVHLEREYRATPDQLWDAWTDPERLARWLGTPAGPLLGATAPVRMVFGGDEDQWADLRVRTADRPKLLELAWDFPGVTSAVLRVEFHAVDDTHTRVVVDHTGLGASAVGYGAGWQAYLDGGLAGLFGAPADADWDELFARHLPVWRQRA